MTIKKFAEQYRLKIRCDECGDSIIPGRRGHLYFDGPDLCAMWTDAQPMLPKTLAGLGGKVWQGDISTNARGRRLQDACVKGIPLENAKEAIRLAGVKRRRILSAEHREVLIAAGSKCRFQPIPAPEPGREVV